MLNADRNLRGIKFTQLISHFKAGLHKTLKKKKKKKKKARRLSIPLVLKRWLKPTAVSVTQWKNTCLVHVNPRVDPTPSPAPQGKEAAESHSQQAQHNRRPFVYTGTLCFLCMLPKVFREHTLDGRIMQKHIMLRSSVY